MSNQTKRCSSCKEHYQLDNFYSDKSKKDGLSGCCKECAKSQVRSYQKSLKGKAVLNAYKSSDAYKESLKKYNHSEARKESHKKYYLSEKFRSKNRERERIRRAKKNKTVVKDFSEVDVLNKHGAVCHICGKDIDLSAPRTSGLGLHLDHVIPLVKGGTHTIENVKPSHAKCNVAKGGRL